MTKVTFQVNVSPLDYPRVKLLLPHQLGVFADQCDEILVVIDLRKSKGRKSSGEVWDKNQVLIYDYIEELKHNAFPGLRLVEVDYSDRVRKAMSEKIMTRGTIPDKDFSGGPYYSYFYGLHAAINDLVFHIDADMMFGGGSGTWIKEAVDILNQDDTIFSCSPLAGPPHDDQERLSSFYRKGFNPTGTYDLPFSYLYQHFTTRAFLLSKRKLYKSIRVERPNLDHMLKAYIKGTPPFRYPEGTISDMLKRNNWYRVGFLGQSPGLWSLHPSGDPSFKELLPKIIPLIEKGDFPESQKGAGDVVPEFEDLARSSNVSL
ncbi:MAG: hypothetical protein AAGC88_04040 [Bacteroidota bacterium]